MKWILTLAICVLAVSPVLGAAPDNMESSPEEMMEKYLARAATEKKHVIAYFGRASTPTLKAFRETVHKWLARAGRDKKFLSCFGVVSDTPGPDTDTCFQGLMDKLDPVPKGWATTREVATPCVFLIAPDGKITAFGTGADWGDDTDANIGLFLTKMGITGGAIALPPEFDAPAAVAVPPPAPVVAKSGSADIGAVVGAVDEATAKRLKLNGDEGVAVIAVAQDSAADKGGLEADDVVIKVNGMRVFAVGGFQDALDSCNRGEAATLELLRDGKTVTVKVDVGSKP